MCTIQRERSATVHQPLLPRPALSCPALPCPDILSPLFIPSLLTLLLTLLLFLFLFPSSSRFLFIHLVPVAAGKQPIYPQRLTPNNKKGRCGRVSIPTHQPIHSNIQQSTHTTLFIAISRKRAKKETLLRARAVI